MAKSNILDEEFSIRAITQQCACVQPNENMQFAVDQKKEQSNDAKKDHKLQNKMREKIL